MEPSTMTSARCACLSVATCMSLGESCMLSRWNIITWSIFKFNDLLWSPCLFCSSSPRMTCRRCASPPCTAHFAKGLSLRVYEKVVTDGSPLRSSYRSSAIAQEFKKKLRDEYLSLGGSPNTVGVVAKQTQMMFLCVAVVTLLAVHS